MRIVCLGGGPAGLYFAILMKLADPRHDITVIERNRPYDTFGWGVVFSDQTLENLEGADPVTHRQIQDNFIHWDKIDIVYRGRTIPSGGHGFCGMGRKKLLNILQDRAAGLGVKLTFETEIAADAPYADCDVIVASDGINSVMRNRYAEHFRPTIEKGRCRYIWLGTDKVFDSFVKAFEETEHGWFEAHVYPFDRNTSTFIVECPEETWLAFGFDKAGTEASIAFSEKLFGHLLDEHRLMSNARHLRGSAWLNFVWVRNEHWHYRNIVLVGDAAHTAHFSIGSGTKLAMEDAITLARALKSHGRIEDAFVAYEAERKAEVARLQTAALNSMRWSENVKRYSRLEPLQFAYSLMTRSQRIGYENLKVRDPEFVAMLEQWLAEKSGAPSRPCPPMFTPFRLRSVELPNRVVVPPPAIGEAEEGIPGEAHLVRVGALAQGGAGLVFGEAAAVSPDAHGRPGTPGIYTEAQAQAWERIVAFAHERTGARMALRVMHAGAKADALDTESMARARERFVAAARRAAGCGFDLLELDCADGALLGSFITSPLNRRRDGYGGDLDNRLRYPLEVFVQLRDAWPAERPLAVRIAASDWAAGGTTPEEAVAIARAFRQAGADLIHVTAGGVSSDEQPPRGRMALVPLSDQIRNEVEVPVLVGGNLDEADEVNAIVAAGRADLCALADAHAADPYWTLRAAAAQGFAAQPWPEQYLTGKAQLERNLQRASREPSRG